MQSYYIPRNYKGEGRILYIFSTKAIIYTAIGIAIGLLFYFIFNLIGLTTIGIIIGSLIVSGLVYKLMQSLVNTILLLLGQISA